MQTKSPLVRIELMAGVPLAILAFVLLLHMQRPAHSSQPIVSNHTAASMQPATALSAAQQQNMTRAYGALPLAFEANQGQTAPEVRYLAHGQGYQLFLTNQEAVLSLRQPAAGANSAKGASVLALRTHRKPNAAVKNSVVRMHFDGANPGAEIAGTKQLPGKTNYFIGNDSTKWHTDVPSYEAVRYQGMYPGVDALFYGRDRRLEYDFVVAPGADSRAIALSISGARKMEIDSHGDVLMSVAGGKLALQKPVIYQEVNGERREIAGNYAVGSDHRIRFTVAEYDHTQPLTIDPILDYSTLLGGTGVFGDLADGLALDAAGNAYLVGATTSTDFPQVNPESSTPPGDIAAEGTAFVAELNPSGTALLYSTYLGGSGNGTTGDFGEAIAVDAASPANVYVTGDTFSPDFPVSTNAYIGPPGPAGTSTGGSAFVTKLNPSLTGAAQLIYSTYLGGDTFDDGHGIAVDTAGNVYVVGVTESTNFPSANPLPYSTNAAGTAFLTEINPSAATGPLSLAFSTYLGGSGVGTADLFGDDAFGLAFGGNSEVFIVGTTTSTDFPVHGTQVDGCRATGSAFASEINVATPAVTYSTCLGGTTEDLGQAIALGTNNLMYLTGQTFSSNFPTVPAGNTIPATDTNGVAFISVINPATGTLTYSTLLGGSNGDYGDAIAVDSAGNAYVTGYTGSLDFPITQGAYQTTNANSAGTTFITEVNPAGVNAQTQLVYSTFLGGSKGVGGNPPAADIALGIALGSGNVYVDGQAGTADFPTSSGAYQTTFKAIAGETNAFAAELTLTPTITVSPTSLDFGTQLIHVPSAEQFVTVTNNTASAIALTLPPTTTGTNAADFAGVADGTTPCTASLAGGASCSIGVTFTPSVAAAETATLNIVDGLDGPSHPMLVALSGNGSGTTSSILVTPSSLTLPGALLTTSSNGSVSITNTGNTPLSIASIAAAPGLFTETDCNAGVFPIVIAPGGPACVVMVTFSPIATTTPGPVPGTLTITQTGGTVTTVPLSGPAWDFSVSAASITVAQGAIGTFPVLVTGLGGFTGAVSFTCTPAMLITSCSVPTTNAAPAPGATATGAITAASFIVPPQSLKAPPSALLRQVLFIMMAIALLFMLPAVRRFRTRLGMAGAMLVFILVAGCSGAGHHRQRLPLSRLRRPRGASPNPRSR